MLPHRCRAVLKQTESTWRQEAHSEPCWTQNRPRALGNRLSCRAIAWVTLQPRRNPQMRVCACLGRDLRVTYVRPSRSFRCSARQRPAYLQSSACNSGAMYSGVPQKVSANCVCKDSSSGRGEQGRATLILMLDPTPREPPRTNQQAQFHRIMLSLGTPAGTDIRQKQDNRN